MKSFLEQASEVWCRWMHGPAMWPVHGKYQCSQCLRSYSVPWDSPAEYPVRRELAILRAAYLGRE